MMFTAHEGIPTHPTINKIVTCFDFDILKPPSGGDLMNVAFLGIWPMATLEKRSKRMESCFGAQHLDRPLLCS